MSAILVGSAAAALLICLVGALAANLRLLREMEAQRAEYECERAWADYYARQAEEAEAALGQLRCDYAALVAAHHRSTLPVLGGAWRAGLGR